MLTHLYPRPTPLKLGDATWQALPLRVRDLCDLEAVALAAAGDKRHAQPAPGDMADPAYRAALRQCVDDAEQYAGGWGGEWCGAVVFGTTSGRATMLQAVLRKHGLTYDKAKAIVPTITAEQWATFDRVAFGLNPLAQIVDRIDRELGIDTLAGSTVPLRQAIVETWVHTKLALRDIYNLTLPQLRTLRAGGTPDDVWGSNETEFQMGPDSQAPDDPLTRARYAFYHEDRVLSPDVLPPDESVAEDAHDPALVTSFEDADGASPVTLVFSGYPALVVDNTDENPAGQEV